MDTKKQGYAKPLPNRFSKPVAEGDGGWAVILLVATGFVAVMVLALGSGWG